MSRRVDAERCAEVIESLDALIEGDLDDSEAAAMTAHIDVCAACQRERRLAEELVVELRSMPSFEIPERVMQAVHRVARPSVMRTFLSFFEGAFRRPLPAIAAVSAVLFLVVVMTPWKSNSVPEYSDQEVLRATDELRLAFAYVGDITRRAELRVKERVFEERVAEQTVRSIKRSFQIIGGVGTTATGPAATPTPAVKGS